MACQMIIYTPVIAKMPYVSIFHLDDDLMWALLKDVNQMFNVLNAGIFLFLERH